MKLIKLICPQCGSQMQVNQDLEFVYCNYCGNKMLVDKEVVEQKITGGFEFGYQQEMGRIKAQQDLEEARQREIEQERKRQIEREEQEKVDGKCKIISITSVGLSVLSVLILLAIFSSDDGIIGNMGQFIVAIIHLVLAVVSIYLLKQKNENKLLIIIGLSVIGIISGLTALLQVPAVLIFVIADIINIFMAATAAT